MANLDVLNIQQSYQIVGRSPLLRHAISSAMQAAPYDVNVLIYGENGAGKEIFHKIIHNCSPRKFNCCIAVNCGGLPEGTIDSELFGHVKGAFTGALTDRKGYFEEADGGTIFLDEIGELPLATQAKLLRIIETGEYFRMGSNEARKTNVRIVAATNVDLQKAIQRGTFREDLYYRLSTITINVPALRERQDDIYLLFCKFASDIAGKYDMPAIQLDDRARMKLVAYPWPGNVRQLLHVVEHISIVEHERLITQEILERYLPVFDTRMSIHDDSNVSGGGFAPGEKEMLYKLVFAMRTQLEEVRANLGLATEGRNEQMQSQLALPQAVSEEDVIDMESEEVTAEEYENPISLNKFRTLDDIEKNAVKNALVRNGGNRKKAAKELGISLRTLARKLENINSDDKDEF